MHFDFSLQSDRLQLVENSPCGDVLNRCVNLKLKYGKCPF